LEKFGILFAQIGAVGFCISQVNIVVGIIGKKAKRSLPVSEGWVLLIVNDLLNYDICLLSGNDRKATYSDG